MSLTASIPSSTTSLDDLQLLVPTPDDFAGMADLQTEAFHSDEFFFSKKRDGHFRNYEKTYERYQRNCPRKLNICRVIKTDEGIILAGCQLMTRLNQESKSTEVFVEWLACHPCFQGKGLGSRLLSWAATFAREHLKVEVLSLFVVQSNVKARRLYERKGFVIRGKTSSRSEPQGSLGGKGGTVQMAWKGALSRFSVMSPFRHLSIHHMHMDLSALPVVMT